MANKVVINTSEENKVIVTQTETDKRIIKVLAVGPRGQKGDPGELASKYSGSFEITGSLNISGALVINNLDILNLSIFRQTGSFWATTNNIEITGSTKTKGNILVDGLISGTFYGDGDNIYFNRVGTNQNTDSTLVIGNWYNNYEYQQTTTFKNSNVIISGNLSIQSGSVLILGATTIPPTPVTGGIYYQLNDGFYITEI